MKKLLLSGSGRVLALAFGIAIAGSGIGKLMDGEAGIAVSSLAVILAVALSVVALVTSITEHFEAAVITVLTLPWILFVAEIGCGQLSRDAGWPLVLVGSAFFAFAARRRVTADQPSVQLAVARST